jgi:formylmethanofuran dehydrogenase subunit B
MDEVPVPLKQLVTSPLPSDEEVLKAITSKLRE